MLRHSYLLSVVAWGKGTSGDRTKENCSFANILCRESLASHLRRIMSCPPQATDALYGQHLAAFKVIWIKMTNDSVNIFSHDMACTRWTWVFFRHLGKCKALFNCSESRRANVLCKFSVPIFTTREAFFSLRCRSAGVKFVPCHLEQIPFDT